MALTIATGFVVDDAIVVVENIDPPPRRGHGRASRRRWSGAREVGFTVLSISLSLMAVFTPDPVHGRPRRRLFREFADDAHRRHPDLAGHFAHHHANAVRALLLRRDGAGQGRHGGQVRKAPSPRCSAVYGRSLPGALRHPLHGRSEPAAVTVVLNVYLYGTFPRACFPQQDTGRMIGRLRRTRAFPSRAHAPSSRKWSRSSSRTRRSTAWSASPARQRRRRRLDQHGHRVRRAEAPVGARQSAWSR